MNRLNTNLWKIEQKRTVLIQNNAGSKKKRCGQSNSQYDRSKANQVSPKLCEIEAKRTIALNFTGSNRERRKLFRRLGSIGIDLFAEDRSTLTAFKNNLTASIIFLTASLISLMASVITINILLFLKVQDFRILCGKIS